MHFISAEMVLKMNDTYSRLVGAAIRKIRQEQHLTQEQLSARMQLLGCDMTRSALAKIECGQRHIYPDELKAVHAVLKVAYEQILIDENTEK